MYLIAIAILLGVIFSLIVFSAGVIYESNKKQSNDFDVCTDNEQVKSVDDNEILDVLYSIRMSLTGKEKESFDYAIDCVNTISELRNWIDEERSKD